MQKGITLVALVVTIVVLLILAGVTIATLFSDNGIIRSAQEAKRKTEEGIAKDEEELKDLMQYMDDAFLITAEKGKMVDENTKVAKYIETNSKGETLKAYIPGGYCIVDDGDAGTNSIEQGLVISDVEGDTMSNNGENGTEHKGNQFVWVPVPDPTTMYEIQNGQKVGKLYDFSSTNGATLITYKNTGYREPDIVTGNSDGTGASYDGSSVYYKDILGFNSTQEFASDLQTKFDKMIESVEKYKGFYIGRYETGNLASSNITPVVQRGKDTISNVNWYWQYKNSELIVGDNNNVTSSMIWGCQWDRTLIWLVESGNRTMAQITNSSDWGNYTEDKKASGYDKAYCKGNIYDLAGNVYDWTIESYDTYSRVLRGGCYYFSGSNYPSSRRIYNYSPINPNNAYGSRSTLIIKP